MSEPGVSWRSSVCLIVVGVVRAVGVVGRRTFAGRTSWRVTESLTAEVVDRVVAQPVPWHRPHRTGDIITRAGVDAEAATHVLNPLPFASSVVLMLVLSAVWLLITDVWLGLAAVAVFPLLIALNLTYQRRVDTFYDTAQNELGKLSEAVHESFDGVTVVKSFGAESRETERLAVIASPAAQRPIRRDSAAQHLRGVARRCTHDGQHLPAGRRGVSRPQRRHDHRRADELHLPVHAAGVPAALDRLRPVGAAVLDSPAGTASASCSTNHWSATQRRRCTGIPATGSSYAASPSTTTAAATCCAASMPRSPVGARLRWSVRTGAGKTTLLHLIAGLIAVDRGSIAVPEPGCVLVFQEPFLLAGSVRDNVALGRSVGDDEIRTALLAAEAGFVEQFSDGLDTIVGERGVGLSGGQRQRIALARALVGSPAALLLDDTTSSLDPATEAKVLANLRETLRDTTVVAVASRPSTIALADDVLYLADGRVVAHGSHDELLADVPEYRRLMEAFEHDRAESAEEVLP